MITLTNDYHHTAVNLNANPGDTLTTAQVKIAYRKLCGIAGCACGGPLGERGPQSVHIIQVGPDCFRIANQ